MWSPRASILGEFYETVKRYTENKSSDGSSRLLFVISIQFWGTNCYCPIDLQKQPRFLISN